MEMENKLAIVFAMVGAVFFGFGAFWMAQGSFTGVPHGMENYGAPVLAFIIGVSLLASFVEEKQETFRS